MARSPYFSSPLFLGFEDIERLVERVSKSAQDGYPPYNIEQIGANGLRITLAVAGFERDWLSVTIEDNQLVIRGKQPEEEDGRTYLHRGIATRQFQRAFVLAEGIEVKAAGMSNGLLNIDLVRPRPETVVKTIEIRSSEDGSAPGRTGTQQKTALNVVNTKREETG